jgi:hypothetical protein
VAGIDSFMSSDQAPSPALPGALRIAVWVALGSTSWAVLAALLFVAVRVVG